MKKIEFRSFDGGYLAFTEESVTIASSPLKAARVFPLGSIASISSSSSLKITTYSGESVIFPMRYMHKKTKRKIKELTLETVNRLGSAEKQEPYTVEFEEAKIARINKIHIPRKSNKKVVRFWAITAIVLCALLILSCLAVGFVKSKASETPQNPKVKLSWKDAC